MTSKVILRRIAEIVLPRFTASMKTVISLPDELFAAADALARKLGLPRSRLVAEALAEYVAKHRTLRVTERLDAVYASETAVVPEPLRRAQRKVLKESEWWSSTARSGGPISVRRAAMS